MSRQDACPARAGDVGVPRWDGADDALRFMGHQLRLLSLVVVVAALVSACGAPTKEDRTTAGERLLQQITDDAANDPNLRGCYDRVTTRTQVLANDSNALGDGLSGLQSNIEAAMVVGQAERLRELTAAAGRTSALQTVTARIASQCIAVTARHGKEPSPAVRCVQSVGEQVLIGADGGNPKADPAGSARDFPRGGAATRALASVTQHISSTGGFGPAGVVVLGRYLDAVIEACGAEIAKDAMAAANPATTVVRTTHTCENPNGQTGVNTVIPRFVQAPNGKSCPAGYYSQKTHRSCITIQLPGSMEPAKYLMVEHGKPCPEGYEDVGR